MQIERSVLDVVISKYRRYNSTEPCDVSLIDWLNDKTHIKDVLYIREITNKEERNKLKAALPAVTISGIFRSRNMAALEKHSGLICIDIDAKDNEHIVNYLKLKDILTTAFFVAYCGLSVSGTGYFLIIPILYPEKHKEHFAALKELFKNIGVNIDTSGKDVCRLRGYSYDPNAYFNHRAEPFKYFIENKKDIVASTFTAQTTLTHTQVKSQVEDCIQKIIQDEIDITEIYEDWINVGFALSTEFGKDGRGYFHQVSQYNSGYNVKETNAKYSSCLANNKKMVGIGTFFFICKAYGIFDRQTAVSAAEDFNDFSF